MIKKVLFLSTLLILFSCGENDLPVNCIRPFSFSIAKNFSNPEFVSARTVNGSAEILGGFKGILIFNAGLDRFLAYDKVCPNNDCEAPMIYDKNRPNILKCSCDGSEYGLGVGIGGAPQTAGFECPAIEYNAVKIGDIIRISSN